MSVVNLDLDNLMLKSGPHEGPEEGGCVVEWATHVAGDPWGSLSSSVCPILSAHLMCWNDVLPDDERQSLKQYIYRLPHTRGTTEVARARGLMAYDWLVRVYFPTFCARIPSLADLAPKLESLPPIADGTIEEARLALSQVRDKAQRTLSTPPPNTALTAGWVYIALSGGMPAYSAAMEAHVAQRDDHATMRLVAECTPFDQLDDMRHSLFARVHDLINRMLAVPS